ncbi:MAG: hypothetical protein FJW99_04350 [Actinobacteria bacterium]|nr:hypothetical protein [Actinomycetota bacterium]MBM3696994.1 hypothetical protein [Actinomycetota bacterium]
MSNSASTATASSDGADAAAGGGAGRGGIAEAIFAEVETMTAGGAMSKSDAFEEISKRTGRRSGTVAANYYRIARKRDGARKPRTRRGRPRGSGRARADVEAVVAKLDDAVKELAKLVRRQEAELATLRAQAAQFDELKKLIAKNS